MTKTKYYDLQMDDPQDDYDVEVVNANLKKIDEQMKTRENATDALQEPEFTVADKRENIASKEKMPKILGKIAKFFADLKAVAFTGNYNDLSDKPTSLPANGGNSDTVNSHTVESNVPKNAKFTDTTYSNFVKSGTGAKAGLVPAPSTTAGTTKYLREDGAWKTPPDTTYSNFVKSGTGAKAGLVPAPSTTAGTTKYLREDGAWKTPPDTKTSVVNNNTTTEPGSALDARQANPNIEGTMAASIAQINSNLKGLFHERSIALPQTTVLDYIVYVNSPIGCQTFTAEHSSDLPRSTGEFNILWFGSGDNYNGSRLHVIAIPYSSSTTRKIYAREYFNQTWLTGWFEL